MEQEKSQLLSILISGNINEDKYILHLILKVINTFQKLINTHFYIVDEITRQQIIKNKSKIICKILNPSKDNKIIDFIITIGGDGTILFAAKQFTGKCPPLITFNYGTLGFLCRFSIENIQSTIDKVIQIKKNKITNIEQLPFSVTTLIRLQGIILTKNNQLITKLALNQISITRQKQNRILLDIFINNSFMTTTAGDGLIISTPTGSTAYALSAGGPVVLNGVNSMLLVPIAPNSLSFRPICLPPNAVIKIKVHILQSQLSKQINKQSRENGLISFDGQFYHQFTHDQQIQIRYQTKQPNNDLICNDKDYVVFQPKVKGNNSDHMERQIQRLKHFLGWNYNFKSPHLCKQQENKKEYHRYNGINGINGNNSINDIIQNHVVK